MHLEPEIVHILGLPIYNTFFTTLVTDAVLLLMVFFIYKNIKPVPGKLQSILEQIISYFYDLTQQIAGKRVEKIFPWVMTFFIYIFATNILALLPGVGTIGEISDGTKDSTEHASAPQTKSFTSQSTYPTHVVSFASLSEYTIPQSHAAGAPDESGESHESRIIPLLRPATSDFNTTLALALISLIATHTIAIQSTGLKDYLSRFFSLNPIYLFVGILELVSEVTKLFSLSFRLFGNIFAGEVVLHTIGELSPLLAPIPFLLLETIVALVQALVFAMLTMVFMSILSTPHHAESH